MEMRKSSTVVPLIGACLIAAAGVSVAGTPSSPTEQRGYNNCVKAAERQLEFLSVERTYYTNTQTEARQFYMNGRGEREGVWGKVRIKCETSRSGHRVFAIDHEPGRYLGRTTVSVAQN